MDAETARETSVREPGPGGNVVDFSLVSSLGVTSGATTVGVAGTSGVEAIDALEAVALGARVGKTGAPTRVG